MKGPRREKVYIYGKNALVEALHHAPHVLRKVFLAPEMHDARIIGLLEANKIPSALLGREEAASVVGRDTSHQGVIAVMDPAALMVPFERFMQTLDLSKHPAVVILGEVQDPHNVGAIIRSAAAFGIAGVLIPEHNQSPVTGTVVKTSAGMAFRIPLVGIGNVNNTIRVLKEKGFWVYGLAMQGARALREEAFDAPAVFVVGNEGAGIREKTLEACDVLLKIPMHERTESLNAAVSASVVFYEWSSRHPESLA
ncbi:MAG: 23S rRNA (guanosine(2251)-2'-O)-methyltransferase RlmB [Patescibacteria group bacterium]|nr:23S rRNA (guanosine(2251)-2'-O)-methyltransferase RlmB [Patescibacteria group bacterium]